MDKFIVRIIESKFYNIIVDSSEIQNKPISDYAIGQHAKAILVGYGENRPEPVTSLMMSCDIQRCNDQK